MEKYIVNCKNTFEKQIALLDSLSPLKTMSRGYSVATSNDGKLVSSISQVKEGDSINLRVTDGNIKAKIESVGR